MKIRPRKNEIAYVIIIHEKDHDTFEKAFDKLLVNTKMTPPLVRTFGGKK